MLAKIISQHPITIDSLKNASKVISKPQESSIIDIISKVDSFYNSAWTKLIWFVGITFTVVGIIVPLLINYFQKKALEVSEAAMKKVISDEISKAEAIILKKAQEAYELKIDQLNQESAILNSSYSARIHHLEANTFDALHPADALVSVIIAVTFYCDAKQIDNAIELLTGYVDLFDRIVKARYDKVVATLDTDPVERLTQVYSEISNNKLKRVITIYLDKIRNLKD